MKATDALRASARAAAEEMVRQWLEEAAQAGFWGTLALNSQDGILKFVRDERTYKVPRLKAAA